MVGGMTRVGQDIPPYTIGGDIPFRLAGFNRVGLKTAQLPTRSAKRAFDGLSDWYSDRSCL